jgi:hypothetical protein
MKKVARMLRSHRELLLNWFRARKTISGGVIEGFNNRLKLTTRKWYGFRTFKVAEIALYHTLGALPDPKWTTNFADEASILGLAPDGVTHGLPGSVVCDLYRVVIYLHGSTITISYP